MVWNAFIEKIFRGQHTWDIYLGGGMDWKETSSKYDIFETNIFNTTHAYIYWELPFVVHSNYYVISQFSCLPQVVFWILSVNSPPVMYHKEYQTKPWHKQLLESCISNCT